MPLLPLLKPESHGGYNTETSAISHGSVLHNNLALGGWAMWYFWCCNAFLLWVSRHWIRTYSNGALKLQKYHIAQSSWAGSSRSTHFCNFKNIALFCPPSRSGLRGLSNAIFLSCNAFFYCGLVYIEFVLAVTEHWSLKNITLLSPHEPDLHIAASKISNCCALRQDLAWGGWAMRYFWSCNTLSL